MDNPVAFLFFIWTLAFMVGVGLAWFHRTARIGLLVIETMVGVIVVFVGFIALVMLASVAIG